jgi:hypothetical protein
MAARCNKAALSVAPGQTFTLAPGQTAACKSCDLAFTFIGISEDSRCPRYTNCVWEGQAVIQLQLSGVLLETVDIKLRATTNDRANIARGGYRLSVQTLDPYPESGQKIAPEDYRLTVSLEQE